MAKILLSDGRLVEDWPSREWGSYERLMRWADAKNGKATVDDVIALYMHHPDMGPGEFEELIEIALRAKSETCRVC